MFACSAAIFTILSSVGCGHTTGEPSKPDSAGPDVVTVEMTQAETRPMETTVAAQGTLAPAQGASARVAPVVAGRLQAVTVREGDRVTAGQTLAVVDNRPQQAAARSAAAALTASEAQARQAQFAARAAALDQSSALRLAQLGLASARLDRDNSVQQAQTALAAAETDQRKTRAGARPQEIAQAEQAVTQAQATRDRAATELERVQFLFDKGIAAKRQLDDAKTAEVVAASALETARQQAGLVRAGARQEDLRAADLRVQQARETLAQAKTSGAAKVRQAEAALRQAEQSALQVDVKKQEAQAMQQTAAQRQADLSAAQATAGYAVLRAPISGIVTRRALNPGDAADPATPVIEIADTRALNLLANLAAEDGQKVRNGMTAHVTTPAAPGRTFTGRVLSVGQVDPQTNLMTVRIAVANPDARLRAGTFATAEIVLRSDPRAVVVPRQAVVTKDGKTVVYVVGADSVAHQTEVMTGPEQNGFVEIRSGLKAGERIVRLGQYELSDGAKVQPPAPAEKAADAGGKKTAP